MWISKSSSQDNQRYCHMACYCCYMLSAAQIADLYILFSDGLDVLVSLHSPLIVCLQCLCFFFFLVSRFKGGHCLKFNLTTDAISQPVVISFLNDAFHYSSDWATDWLLHCIRFLHTIISACLKTTFGEAWQKLCWVWYFSILSNRRISNSG